jgi:hypothetical protein
MRYTIKEVIELTAKNTNPKVNMWIYFGDFLDHFYSESRTTKERFELVREEPEQFENIEERDYAFISGAVQKICSDYEVEIPEWVFKEKYFLTYPYFALDAQNELRLVLLAESPFEFRMRNIFTTANTLDRV